MMTDYNPRGNLWANDENSFGRRLLSKMGWQKGKGLGKHEDGNTEAIKVRKKNKPTGLGWEEKQPVGENNFEYDQLLQNLKKKSNVTSAPKAASSLELMSQKSRSRIHYQKIVKGKDICSYSERDMKSIFFKVKPEKELTFKKIQTEPECNGNALQHTFESTMSSKDYFTMKLKSKKGSNAFMQHVSDGQQKNGLPNDFAHQIQVETEKPDEVSENNMCDFFMKQEPKDSYLTTNDTKCFQDETLDADLDRDCVTKLNKKRKKNKHTNASNNHIVGSAAEFLNGTVENDIKQEPENLPLSSKGRIRKSPKLLNESYMKCFQNETSDAEINNVVSKLSNKSKRSKHKDDLDNADVVDPAVDRANESENLPQEIESTYHSVSENEIENVGLMDQSSKLTKSTKKDKKRIREETENLHSSYDVGIKPKKLKGHIPVKEFSSDAPSCLSTSTETIKEEKKRKKKLAKESGIIENKEENEGSDNQFTINGVTENPDPDNSNPTLKRKSKKRKRDSIVDNSNDLNNEKLESKKQKKNKSKNELFKFNFELLEENGNCSSTEMEPQSCDVVDDKTTFSEKIKTFTSKKIKQLKSCIKTSKHFLSSTKQRVSFKELIDIKQISPRKTTGDSCDENGSSNEEESEILNSENNESSIATDNDYVACLDIPPSASFDCWIESQRQACKLKSYRDVVEKIRKNETLKTTNWLDIKGYGNWGF